MAQLGRNAHCHCGSGKKYKKCCLAKDEAAAPPKPAPAPHDATCAGCGRPGHVVDEFDDLDDLSNSVPALVRSGRLEEAEAVCRTLKEKYPDQIDYLERGAMVAEARGDRKAAADLYRQCVVFIDHHDGFDDELRESMIEDIARLDPREPVPA